MEDKLGEFEATHVEQAPNSTAVLVLGIVSIVGCFCYGTVGLICGIIALVLARTGKKAVDADPSKYTHSSVSNLKAGKICAIIGLSLSAIYFLMVLGYLVFVGTMLTQFPWEELQNQQY